MCASPIFAVADVLSFTTTPESDFCLVIFTSKITGASPYRGLYDNGASYEVYRCKGCRMELSLRTFGLDVVHFTEVELHNLRVCFQVLFFFLRVFIK